MDEPQTRCNNSCPPRQESCRGSHGLSGHDASLGDLTDDGLRGACGSSTTAGTHGGQQSGNLPHFCRESQRNISLESSPVDSSRRDKTFPCSIPAPKKHATGNRFYFLSEIGVNCLVPFLKTAAYNNISGKITRASNCTLVIDQFVELSVPLVMPSQFTIAGVGINGAGRLRFKDLGSQPAITLQGASDPENQRGGHFTIRDLVIENAGGCSRGILAETNQLFFERISLRGFDEYGIQGRTSLYAHVRDSIIERNGVGIELLSEANGWRVSGCTIRNNTTWGVAYRGAISEGYIRGCRFANNGLGGILVEPVDGEDFSFFVALIGNSFASNNGIAAKIVEADSPRFVGNVLFDDEVFVDNISSLPGFTRLQRETQVGFNASLADANQEKLYTLKDSNDP